MSADIVDMLLDSVYVFVEPSCGQSYQVQQLEICPLDDGSYAMEAVFADYYQTMVQEMTEKALEAGQDRLYLTVDSIRLASAPLTEPITDGRVRFTNLEWYGKETISEEDCYLLEFIQECVEGTDMPYMGYYLDFVWTEAEEMSYGLLLEKAKEMEEKMTAAVEAICPGAEVYRNSTYWSIHLNLPLDEKLPETAMTMIQEMYENCYMENGEYGSSFYIYPCEDALSFYCYFSENTDTYAMQYTGYCTGEVMRPYQDTVRRLEEESTFFGEAVQATEYSAGFVFE